MKEIFNNCNALKAIANSITIGESNDMDHDEFVELFRMIKAGSVSKLLVSETGRKAMLTKIEVLKSIILEAEELSK